MLLQNYEVMLTIRNKTEKGENYFTLKKIL